MKKKFTKYAYHIKLIAVLALFSSGVTSVISHYVPERQIKEILRKGRRRVRRMEELDLRLEF